MFLCVKKNPYCVESYLHPPNFLDTPLIDLFTKSKNCTMKIFKKILKGFTKLIGILLAVMTLAGLACRLFGPEAHEPMGKLIDIGGLKLHINPTGVKDSKPTLVIEGGCGMATEYYHWLSEGLKDSMRVVRYDRAGIGYSEASNTPRTPETIARELHQLLQEAGESPPYILAGHSLGGPYIRVFAELYPDEVVAMVFLDATHPKRAEKISSIPEESSWKWKLYISFQKGQVVLADMGILMLYDKLTGPLFGREMEGLPDDINSRTVDFLKDGKYFRAATREFENYYSTLQRAGTYTDFGSLPIRIFHSATREIPQEVYEKYLKIGVDLRKNQLVSKTLIEDYRHLSTDNKIIELNGDHNTMYTIKENAAIICEEVLQLLGELEYYDRAASNFTAWH